MQNTFIYHCILPRTIFVMLAYFYASTTLAEYRAFLLQIKTSENEPAISVKSNLDPEQYRYYYHLSPGAKVTYTETWMCPPKTEISSFYKRTTGYQSVCKSPKEIEADKAAAQASGDTSISNKSTQSPERSPANK